LVLSGSTRRSWLRNLPPSLLNALRLAANDGRRLQRSDPALAPDMLTWPIESCVADGTLLEHRIT
jgi:hypothetical protein